MLLKLFAALVALSAVATARPTKAIVDNSNTEVVSELSTDDYRLIETGPNQRTWMNEVEVMNLIINNVGFIDVTDTQDYNTFVPGADAPIRSKLPIPTALKRSSQVKSFLPQLSKANLQTYLTKLSSFQTRYYTSTYGVQSAQWIFDTLTGFAAGNPRASVRVFTNTWSQFSVIARIEGKVTDSDIVVLGAHQDSINSGLTPNTARAPGADDDGSGTVCIMEAFRVLAENKDFQPDLPIEFHFYSAEEVGLRGSQAISQVYSTNGVTIRGMMQTDMTGYNSESPKTIGVVTDNTNADLNKFIRTLISGYLTTKAVDTTCGYGCSDHDSWHKLGYPASFPFEAQFKNKSPYIHTAKDDLNTVDYDHMLQFAHLDLSFAIELSTI